MGQKKPNPIQVVELPTYSFGLKLSNVRCLESSFNERVIPANQSVVDIFLSRSCEILFMYVEAGASCRCCLLVGLGKFPPSRKQVFHKSNFATASLLLFGTPGKKLSMALKSFSFKSRELRWTSSLLKTQKKKKKRQRERKEKKKRQ